MYVFMYVCMHACMYVCMHVCTFVCIYIYMYIHRNSRPCHCLGMCIDVPGKHESLNPALPGSFSVGAG